MDGRFPTEFGEIAITDGIEEEFSLSIGDSAVFDGTELTVVGIVENPSDFSDEFVFVDPAATASLGMVSIFVDADEDLVESFRPDGGGSLSISGHGGVNEATVAAIGVLGIATVGLLFVALLSAAGYAVVAQRRQQQLGLFASIGATERQVRSVMVTNGYIAGTVATVTGAGIGLVAWLAAQGPLESAVGYRVPTFSIPWWLVGTLIVIGIGSSTFAAWWPSRAVSRTSVVRALSGRPTAPRSVHRSVAVSGFLIAAGVVSMAVAGDLGDDRTIRWVNVALVLGGTVAVTVGLLLASPLAIRLTAVAASHVRVGPRIALRDLARYQSRSAAALAAILLGLGIAVAILIASTAAQYTAETGNLAVDQIMIRATHFGGPFVPTANEVSDLDASVSEVADALDANAVTPLLVAADARVENDTVFPGRIAISLAIRVEDGWSDLSLLYVATPELMARLGDVGGDQSSGLAVATDDDELALLGVSTPSAPSGGRPTVAEWSAFVPKYTSLPAAISSVDHLEAKDWAAIPSGQWLVDVDTVSPETLSDAKDLAAAAGLTIEVRDSQGGLGAMRAIATTVGMLVALGVIAAMVALIRGETTKDHETLTETGAPAGVRRSIVATTAATFAILGVLLGGAAAAVIVTVGYIDDLSILTRLPVGYVLAIAIGTPVIAGLGGWITGGGDVSRPRSFGDLA
jgi:putative ABC transport system permease protein